MQNIERLIQLAAEFEGLLHVLARRDDQFIRSLLKTKYANIAEEYSILLKSFDEPRAEQTSLTEQNSEDKPAEHAEEHAESQPDKNEEGSEFAVPEPFPGEDFDEVPFEVEDIEEIKEVNDQMTDVEVKDQEAEESQVDDETDTAARAIEHEEAKPDLDALQDTPQETPLATPLAEVAEEDVLTFVFEDEEDEDDSEEEVVTNLQVATEQDATVTPSAPDPAPAEKPSEAFVLEDDDDVLLNSILSEKPKAEPVKRPLQTSVPTVDDMLKRQEAADLRRVFTLNDKMRFRRALFGQNDENFARALERLAVQPTFAEAMRLVTTEFGWTPENPDVQDFMSIIKPHYRE